MEWVFLVFIGGGVAFGIWVFSKIYNDYRKAQEAAENEARQSEHLEANLTQLHSEPTLHRRPPLPKASVLEFDPSRIHDLRELGSVRMRIRGAMYYLSDADRERFSGTEYLLVREPKNRHDKNAVAVYCRGRKVGYVSATKAAAIAPLLDQVEADAFLVNGAAVAGTSMRTWIDVPRVPDLRAHVKKRAGSP